MSIWYNTFFLISGIRDRLLFIAFGEGGEFYGDSLVLGIEKIGMRK